MRTLMASLAMLHTVFKTDSFQNCMQHEKCHRRFRSKEVLKTSLILKFVRSLFGIGLALRARSILKLLARLLPELYSTYGAASPLGPITIT